MWWPPCKPPANWARRQLWSHCSAIVPSVISARGCSTTRRLLPPALPDDLFMRKSFVISLIVALCAHAQAELRIPAFTAYLDPDADGARVSERSGITRWQNPELKVKWFGEIKTPGKLDATVALRLPDGGSSKLRLTIAGQSHEATATGTNLVKVDFGS